MRTDTKAVVTRTLTLALYLVALLVGVLATPAEAEDQSMIEVVQIWVSKALVDQINETLDAAMPCEKFWTGTEFVECEARV